MNSIWGWLATKEEETEQNDLQKAIAENRATTATTIKLARKEQQKANGVLKVAENALDILNRLERKEP
jgi:hypothetical protein